MICQSIFVYLIMQNMIYGIIDSQTGLIHYVGKTTQGDKRPLSHLKQTHCEDLAKWIESNQDRCDVIVIELVDKITDLAEREAFWIQHYKKQNPNIFNKQYAKINNRYTSEDNNRFWDLLFCTRKYGDIIRKRRLAVRLSQDELSEMAGISRSTLSLIENGCNVKMNSINNIVRVLLGYEMNNTINISERVSK